MKQLHSYTPTEADQAYLHKRSITIMTISVITVIACGIMAAWMFHQSQKSVQTSTANSPDGSSFGSTLEEGENENGDRSNAGANNPSGYTDGNENNRGISGKAYLKSDGSLNQAAIDNIQSKIGGSQVEKNFHKQLAEKMEAEVADGTITTEQQQLIKEAFGMEE